MAKLQEDRSVGVFWDYENCCPAQSIDGASLVNSIRKALEGYGPIKQFRAYKDADLNPNSLALRVELQASGVSIIDCPHNNQKDVVDKVLIVDVMVFSREYPNATIVLIAGDRDYAYMISILRSYLHHVVVVTPGSKYIAMRASEYIEWKSLLPGPRPVWAQPGFVSAPNVLYRETKEEPNPQPRYQVQKPPVIHTSSSRYTCSQLTDEEEPSSSIPMQNTDILPPVTSSTVVDDEESEALCSPINDIDEFELARMIPLPRSPSSESSQLPSHITFNDNNDVPGTVWRTSYANALSALVSNNQTTSSFSLPTFVAESTSVVRPELALQPQIQPFKLSEEKIIDFYGPLIRVLLQIASEGNPRPLRGTVAERLKQLSPSPFKKCNVSSWAAYARTAESANVIVLGSDPAFQGRDWVELKSNYRSSKWKAKVGFTSTTGRTSVAVTMPSIPKKFMPMLQLLAQSSKEGRAKMPRSGVNDQLMKIHGRGFYDKYGFSSWREYASAAEEAGYVKLTGGNSGGGDTSIALDSKWRGKIPL